MTHALPRPAVLADVIPGQAGVSEWLTTGGVWLKDICDAAVDSAPVQNEDHVHKLTAVLTTALLMTATGVAYAAPSAVTIDRSR
mgnify:CR=1 FL=1